MPQSPDDPAPPPASGLVPRLALPPGYDAAAAKSALRRYPRQLSILRAASAGFLSLDPGGAEALASAPLSAVWLGHATVLLRVLGKWVLTDPVFSERIGVKLGPVTFGVPRLLPAVDPTTLPRVDLVLVSHAHFDHLDRPSLRALTHDRTIVVTARSTRALVPRGFADVRELDWDQETDADGLLVRAVRPAHWGARTMWDKHRGFNSYVLRAREGGREVAALYAGDTAFTRGYQGLGRLDLSIFGIGAYDPWIKAHANPEQAWQMHQDSGATYLLPMHHSTFELSDEPKDEPMRRLLAVAQDQAQRVIGRELGIAWTAPTE